MIDYYDSELEMVDGVGLLTVTGETDLYSGRQFRRDLGEAIDFAHGDVILDLTDLDLVDSTALGIMMVAEDRMMREGRQLVLVVCRSNVLRVFQITGLSTHFSIVPTRDTAIARIAASRAVGHRRTAATTRGP